MEYLGEGSIQDLRNRVFKRRGTVTLNNQGEATIAFDPPIEMGREPFLTLQPWIASGSNPVICNPVAGSLTVNGEGRYTGVSVKGARAQDLPGGLTSLNLVVQLNGRKVTEVGSLGGVRIDWMAF